VPVPLTHSPGAGLAAHQLAQPDGVGQRRGDDVTR